MSNTKTVMSQAANTLVKPLEVEDVFSTYLYTGTGSDLTITNGIDLAGEGGMVWNKGRTAASYNNLADTERGPTKVIYSNEANAEVTSPSTQGIKSFNSDGITFGTNYFTGMNQNGEDSVLWTFRKAPKFFDVVTWTGDGVAGRTVSHNLGSTPGVIITKRTDANSGWYVYHTSLGATKNLQLSATLDARTRTQIWNDTAPTDLHFSVGTDSDVNLSGGEYVAYLFAHNDGDAEFGPDGDADIIKCGSYTGNGSTNGPEIDLGFEPQWVMTKRSDSTGNWIIQDSMRSLSLTKTDMLFPNLSNAATTGAYGSIAPNATGFKIVDNGTNYNASGATYIYIAIRRGTKVPESGTEVFGLNEYTGNNTAGRLITSSGTGVVDAAFINSSGSGSRMASRLTGIPYLTRNDTSAEINSNTRFENFDDMNGFFVGSNSQVNSSSFTYLAAMWKRAPGFFDVVAYTGDGTAGRTVSHNLSVAPEMMIVKKRNSSTNSSWIVYHSGNTAPNTTNAASNFLVLNSTQASLASLAHFNRTMPSSTEFTLGTSTITNNSGDTFIAYLFASLPGISKVGSYTGNGTSQTIDCGFTSGARYVLVKRTNTTGDWVEFNSEYGIVAGNEKAWRVNAGGDTGTSLDLIDPDNSGFIINQEASYNLNVNNSTYIFYAIA